MSQIVIIFHPRRTVDRSDTMGAPFSFLLFKNAYEPPKTTWMGLGHFLLEIGKCPPNSHLNPAIVIDVLDERLNCI